MCCSLPLSRCHGIYLCSVPGPLLPWPPHPPASAAHQPVPNLLCTEAATGFRVLGTVFPSWQHCRGCLVLPEQLLCEDKRPQTVNYRATPFAHRHECHEILCTYRDGRVRGSREHGDTGCPTLLSLLVPGCGICQRWAFSFCVMLLFASSEEAQGEVMLGESCLR